MIRQTLHCALFALVVGALLPAGEASARDRRAGQTAVEVAPGLADEWILQLSPGSGVVPGYRRPDLRQPRQIAPAPSGVVDERMRPISRERMRDPMKTAGLKPVRRDTAPTRALDPQFLPQTVAYAGKEKAGTIVIDTNAKFLYMVEDGGQARRYGVGVGKPGFEWAGRHRVTRKSEWPTWTPPSQMRAREAAKGRILPASMQGGPENPLGARAMYLGSTLYRIHGTNQPWTIGKAVSSGCIRMRNEDVMDLYERVPVGTSVIVM